MLDERFIDMCETGNLAEVKRLSPSHSLDSPSLAFGLCWAAMYGHCDIVVYLVSLGVDFRGYGDDGLPIRWAAMNGHLPVVKQLLSVGATINPSDISIASDNGHFELVKYIMSTTGVGPTNVSQKLQDYFLFCDRMEKKKQERAQRKIYFWWIQICYDMNRECGKRMAENNFREYEKLLENYFGTQLGTVRPPFCLVPTG